MREGTTYLKVCTLVCVMMASLSSFANMQKEKDDKNLSPYFLVLSKEGEIAKLPLKSTKVDVEISGVIADVNVKQVYTNTGKSTIEAIYVFPASTKAAVYDMLMTVDGRKIRAVIKEKQQARKMYDRAKREGRTTSLLEQERTNVFKMKVANILPGATVKVDMKYTELLIPTNKIYGFVYPTVVGPRYVSGEEMIDSKAESWTQNPYLEEGVKPTSSFDLQLGLSTSIPIKDLACETHENDVKFLSKSNAKFTLKESDGGNRDFILKYRLAGNVIESGILTYSDPNGENYFLAMMQPPQRPSEKDIPAREYVFIVDVSGSMRGFPLTISKVTLTNLLNKLNKDDLFNIVFFAGSSKLYSQESLPVTKENISKAIDFMDSQSGYGGTELITALKRAMNLNLKKNYSRSFVILTDGYVSVENETYDYIRDQLGEANFFSFGIGSSVNRGIIEGMAHVGYGEPFIATTPIEAKKLSRKLIKYISNPVLTNIRYQFSGIEAYDVLPQQIPDLFAERPLIISGKFKGETKGKLIIKGLSGDKQFLNTLEIKSNTSEKTSALKHLWAREKIRLLADYYDLRIDEKKKKELIDLSLKYNLLTRFTSFIAIDSVISNEGGNQESIQQALPLPKGVSNFAIKGRSIPITRQGNYPPPPPAPKSSNLLTIVDNDSELEIENSEVLVVEESEEDDEQPVFVIVEDMPKFPGGNEALAKFIADNIRYPKSAKANKIEGPVYIGFIIDKDGSVINVKVLRGVNAELDAEAIRVIKSMPKWTPGKQRGKPVRVNYTLPIIFSLKQ